jgi:hypothetical protein
MSTVLFMGGIFNIQDPILGLPLYMWSWVLFTFLIIVSWAAMYYLKWKPLTPLHGLFYAQRNRSTVAFTFDATLAGDLVSERDAKCIFDYATGEHGENFEIDIPDHPILDKIPGFKKLQVLLYTTTFYYPTKYLKYITPTQAAIGKILNVNKDVDIARVLEGGVWERSPSVTCAAVPVDIVVDMDNWTLKRTPQHQAIVKSARDWNQMYPTDQIHSYQKYQKYLLEGKISAPRELKISQIVPWQRIDAAFPLDLDENEWAGKKWQKSKDDENAAAGDLNKLAMWVLLGGLVLAGLMLAARVALAFAHPA